MPLISVDKRSEGVGERLEGGKWLNFAEMKKKARILAVFKLIAAAFNLSNVSRD